MCRRLNNERVHAVAHRYKEVGGERSKPKAGGPGSALQSIDSFEVRERMRRSVVHREEERPRHNPEKLRGRALLDEVHHRALQYVLNSYANFVGVDRHLKRQAID